MVNDARAFAAEGKCAGGHLVEHHTKGEEISAEVEFFSANLFWRHVRNGANGGAGAGEIELHGDGRRGGTFGIFEVAGMRDNFREAEVKNFGEIAFRDENVSGLDVAMD